jgi:TIR domain
VSLNSKQRISKVFQIAGSTALSDKLEKPRGAGYTPQKVLQLEREGDFLEVAKLANYIKTIYLDHEYKMIDDAFESDNKPMHLQVQFGEIWELYNTCIAIISREDARVERLQKRIGHDKYHFALSFAGEDRDVVKQIADCLSNKGYKVFYDDFYKASLWGKNLYDELIEVYNKRSQFCVIFISENYKKKAYPNHERQAAQAKAFSESFEYILPIKLDDTDIPSILPTMGYVDYRKSSVSEICDILTVKIDHAMGKSD